jgi:aspartyl-tRNA(Asn)/glutamyl-tRNA(Gln) amidotransferase subunit C
MSLSLDEVKRVAFLARIAVTDAEAEATRAQLNDIFAMISAMRSVDTAGIAPMSHAQDVTLRLRDDAVTEVDQRAPFHALAPQVEGDLYLVPRVIE